MNIMRPSRRKSVIIVCLIIAVVAVVGVLGWQRLHNNRNARALSTSMEEIPVRAGDVAATVSALGNLEPYVRVEVKCEAAGKIERVFVEEGDPVKKGQPIARIDPGDLPVKLKQAEAGYLSARAKLNKLLAGPDASDLAQAEASYEQARISLEDAKKQLSRDEALFRTGAISEQQLQESRSRVKLNEQQFLAAKEKLESLRRGPDKEDIEVARAELAQAEANLDSIRSQVNSLTATAPIDGTVTDIKVQVGDVVKEETSLAVIADLTKMKAVIPVNEIDIPKIAPGQQVLITLDALPGQRFQGKVSSVGYEGQIKDNIVTYEVTASIPNPGGKLRGGMTADVTVVLQSKENVLVVPIEALQERRGQTIVLVPGDDGPTRRPVRVGLRNDSVAEIVDGLSLGDRVLVRRVNQVTSPGSTVPRAQFGNPFGVTPPGFSTPRTPSGNRFGTDMSEGRR
ncbi:MAG TPA: efflux RND transporter periplasmic adaptor subunit [Firmicutes bacterium]|nr:efflux RND transporter periplasmic adaptor subunit [Bacillota bacterium]